MDSKHLLKNILVGEKNDKIFDTILIKINFCIQFQSITLIHNSNCCFFSFFLCFRFGDVLGINNLPDGSLSIKFKDRKEAEIALANGAFYDSGVLVMDWLETDTHSSTVG